MAHIQKHNYLAGIFATKEVIFRKNGEDFGLWGNSKEFPEVSGCVNNAEEIMFGEILLCRWIKKNNTGQTTQ